MDNVDGLTDKAFPLAFCTKFKLPLLQSLDFYLPYFARLEIEQQLQAMTSMLALTIQLPSRRHMTEPTLRPTSSAPSLCLSEGAASHTSGYDGRARSLKDARVTVTCQQQTENKPKSNWTSRLAEEIHRRKQARDQKKAEEHARNEKLKREVNKILVSRHASAVREKLNAGHVRPAPLSPAHMSAAQQEMRYPHSGPPAIHGGHKEKVRKHEADMPALARIVSGDEVDDEEESMKQRMDAWQRTTRSDEWSRKFSEGRSLSDDDTLTDSIDGAALQDARGPSTTTDVTLEREKFQPKHHAPKNAYVGYKRDRNGVWTKERSGPYILHNV
ncbi:hypothetical protein DV738_g3565, partial [Chaetothyriales sp. CBS 135597]